MSGALFLPCVVVRAPQAFSVARCPAGPRSIPCSRNARSSAAEPSVSWRERLPVRFARFTLRAVAAAEGEAEAEIEEDAMDKMDKTLESVQRNFTTVRTGRASPTMLDRVEVDYYGAMTPLRQIAGVSTPDASQIVVQPYDVGAIGAIEKALLKSDLGLTPSNDGKLIRLNIPQLTADRRKEMAKLVSKMGEEGKVAIRNVRRDAMKAIEKLKKDGTIGEDGQKNLEDTIQKLTDDYVKDIDKIAKNKADELSKV